MFFLVQTKLTLEPAKQHHCASQAPKIVSCGSKYGSQGRIKPNLLAPNATRGVADAKHGSTIPSALNDKIYYVDQRLSLQLKGIVVRTQCRSIQQSPNLKV